MSTNSYLCPTACVPTYVHTYTAGWLGPTAFSSSPSTEIRFHYSLSLCLPSISLLALLLAVLCWAERCNLPKAALLLGLSKIRGARQWKNFITCIHTWAYTFFNGSVVYSLLCNVMQRRKQSPYLAHVLVKAKFLKATCNNIWATLHAPIPYPPIHPSTVCEAVRQCWMCSMPQVLRKMQFSALASYGKLGRLTMHACACRTFLLNGSRRKKAFLLSPLTSENSDSNSWLQWGANGEIQHVYLPRPAGISIQYALEPVELRMYSLIQVRMGRGRKRKSDQEVTWGIHYHFICVAYWI